MSLLNIGLSGLSAAELALGTVGNNITNANTPGYDEETVIEQESVNQSVQGVSVGSGVSVQSIARSYSSFMTTAVWNTNSSNQAATTTNALATTLNSILSSSGNIQTSLDSFYSAFGEVANTPGTSSSLESALASADSVASQFNTFGQQLQLQQSSVNEQISTTVQDINTQAADIAKLNAQIMQAGANPPNALLDQRDQLIQNLSSDVGISTDPQPDGSIDVYSSSGQALVAGGQSFQMTAGQNQYDDARTDVFDMAGNDVTNNVTGGKLGALLNYRSTVLDPTQIQLGNEAAGLAASVNGQQAAGMNQYGEQGGPIFSVPSPTVLPSTNNTGTASITGVISNVANLGTSNITMKYTGAAWNATDSNGKALPVTTNPDGTLSVAGLTLTVAGSASAGDTFQVQPTQDASIGITTVMTDPNDIAAAALMASSSSASNKGTGAVTGVTVTNTTNANLMDGATVSFPTAGTYQITDTTTGSLVASGAYTPGQTLTANGWSMTLSGTPAAGDSFNVAPNSKGLNDTSNALAMSNLADKGVLNGGKSSIVQDFGGLTTQIGIVGSQATTNLTTQNALFNQAVSSQQSVSGVNLDQEAASLVQYQQSYQACAQVISTSKSIFDSLITAMEAA